MLTLGAMAMDCDEDDTLCRALNVLASGAAVSGSGCRSIDSGSASRLSLGHELDARTW